MAHHISRDITPLTYTFTENTDISLDSNRHMMLHELQKLMQEMRNMKAVFHNNEEKSKRLKIENDTRMQKLLDEMKEMKLYINELEMEKQRTNRENNELKTQVTALKEKQEKEINELSMIEEKLIVEMNEFKLFMNELKTEKERTNAEHNEMRTQVTNLSEKQDKTINESRMIVSGQETKISELETKYRELNTQIMILKENVPTPNIINGLYEQMLEDHKSKNWSRSKELMKRHLDNSTSAYEQLNNITDYNRYPLEAAERGNKEIIQVMLDNGLPVNNVYIIKTLNNGYYAYTTLLHSAAEYGHYELVKFLIQRGADMNVRNMYGYTPLHCAALGGHKSVVQYLVDKGCDTTITNNWGETAADIAITQEIREIIQ